jgi:two-component system, chemotaxis family, chemotaxis protein CheY
MASSVLVVDDDPNLVRLMSKFLKMEGFAPVPAANGEEALAYLRSGGDASVILLDLRMPVMDGWAFRREQRADAGLANIPIVVLSGVEADRVHELDAAASFNKPVSFPEVVVVVRRLCEAPRWEKVRT